MLRGKLQVWEQTDTALTRVMCSAAGVNFWATCWRGLELPEEDKDEGMCGLLLKSMYGTRDAPRKWGKACRVFFFTRR